MSASPAWTSAMLAKATLLICLAAGGAVAMDGPGGSDTRSERTVVRRASDGCRAVRSTTHDVSK